MSLRSYIANTIIGWGRALGRSAGAELKVELDEHRIEIGMVHPNSDKVAWDPDLYDRGNVFPAGYANPIKPVVGVNEELEDPDTVEVEEGGDGDGDHVKLISSPRYHKYMQQDLVDSLLTPQEKWRRLAYLTLGVGGLVILNLGISLYGSGAI